MLRSVELKTRQFRKVLKDGLFVHVSNDTYKGSSSFPARSSVAAKFFGIISLLYQGTELVVPK
jgi:hypothetical protein